RPSRKQKPTAAKSPPAKGTPTSSAQKPPASHGSSRQRTGRKSSQGPPTERGNAMASSEPALAPEANGGGGATASQPPTVGERKRQYLVGQQAAPGIQPFDLNLLEQNFNQNPNVEVVRKLTPPGIAGVFSSGPGGGGAQSVLVTRMTDDVADRLKMNAGPALVVEEDAPVSFA